MKRFFEVINEFKDSDINLPKRSTKNSVGYDFEAAEDVVIPGLLYQYWNNIKTFGSIHKRWEQSEKVRNSENHKTQEVEPVLIRTGIKAKFPEDEGLFLYNRSSNPGKRGLILANGVGVIETDYYNNPDNEGEILFAFYSLKLFSTVIKKGEKIGQGVFQKFLLVDNDNATGERLGGLGSTGK